MDRRIESVLFDLDNTLIDRTGGFRRFCVELYRSNDAIRRVSTEDEAVDLMVELDEDGMCDRHQLFEQVISKWPGAFENEEEAVELYTRQYPTLISLAPRTRRLLEDIRSRGVQCGVVTNGGSEMQWTKVKSSGLVALVDAVVVSGDLEIRKPDPRIFELGAREDRGQSRKHAIRRRQPGRRHSGRVGSRNDLCVDKVGP